MADQADQNQTDVEVLNSDPVPEQTGETEVENVPIDQSNNQSEEQADEASADVEEAAGADQTQESPGDGTQEATADNDEQPAGENDDGGKEEMVAEKTDDGPPNENEQNEEEEEKNPGEDGEMTGEVQRDEQEVNKEDTEVSKEDPPPAEQSEEVPAEDSAPAHPDEAPASPEKSEPSATDLKQESEPSATDLKQEENEPSATDLKQEESEPSATDLKQEESDPSATDLKQDDNEPSATDLKEEDNEPSSTDLKQDASVEEEPTQEDGDPVAAPSPVQVETNVAEAPPGSPKVAMEERKPHSNVNLEATATVKFVLMPSGQVVTLACTLGQTLDSLKAHFAVELKMSVGLIMIMFDGKNMSDSTTLADLGVGPNGTVQLEMQSADPVNTPLKPYRPRQEYHMPDVITVRVMTEDGEAKDVVVEIERSRCKKPFLGGFRNKNSGAEYHNAAAQTMKKPRPPPTVERFCRDTQTCQQKNMRQQTTNTTSTQMTGVGVYISNIEDKLVTPGKYFSADEHWDMILRNVIILQKYYRRWLAKRYVTKLKEDKARRLEWERQEELRKKREKEERIKRDYARRLNPKTKADFDMLLNCLEKWRQEEMERINLTLTGAERKAALCMLLDQETELLSAIERHKNEANTDNRDNRIIAFLEKAAAPKKWQGHDGNLTYMDTPFTIRAKELRDIYNSINMKYLTQDERLDVLLTLKHTVKEHDCKLTQEIIELIDREADLLMRGVKEGNLTGLRKRISTLFLQYIKTPTFNPEAARLLKVPQDPSTLRKNINYCHSCGRYLPSTEFFITSNSKQVGRCRNCMKIENDGRQREDYTFYRVMLKALRKSEEAVQDGSSICYLLQENDLRYLVENIWSNQSVLSAWDDLYDLVLVRWDKHQEWSPWNCILLTHDEAEAHQKLFSLEEGYGQVFIHKVTQKHNFARNYFSRLPGMAELLRQKVGNRDLINNNNGPVVSGHTVQKAQRV